jgi:hypothetical protein
VAGEAGAVVAKARGGQSGRLKARRACRAAVLIWVSCISVPDRLLACMSAGEDPPSQTTQSEATPAGAAGTTRIRALDPRAESLLWDALARSPTVERLLGQLCSTDVVVYVAVTPSPDGLLGTPRGTVNLISANADSRYLQVWVDAAQRPAARIAVLAHEIQHALEIGARADVRDIEGFRRMYERLGTASGPRGDRGGVRRFETAMAVRIEAQVLAELRQRRPAW